MRLAQKEVEPYASNTGEINCLKWKNVIFSWSGTCNNADEYTAIGHFVGIHPKYMYENLTIVADFVNKTYYLRTGKGKKITYINLLDLNDI